MHLLAGQLLRRALVIVCLTLTACGGGAGGSSALPCLTTASALHRIPMDIRTELSAGYVEPLCGASRAGAPHCLGYRVSVAGMRALGYTREASTPENTTSSSCPQGNSGSGGTGSGGSGSGTGSNTTPSGYAPSDLQSAYGLTSASANSGSGRTVAVIELGDAPRLESDLEVYRSTFGLSACTVSNGCLTKVNQDGNTIVPAIDIDWAAETTADVEMISAICPNCNILVVELAEPADNFAAGLSAAARLGATAISSSWGMSESPTYASVFKLPGITLTAASGDNGYATPLSPADYSTVIAVGGTSLVRASNARGWSETAWNGAGSGCSQAIAKPSWQHDSGCSMRTVTDISFDADPATGVAYYNTTPGASQIGWGIVGGTSIGSPAIAAMYALAGAGVDDASGLYANASMLNDITGGPSPSVTCAQAYLCNAEPGYDAPTGNGSPNGLTVF